MRLLWLFLFTSLLFAQSTIHIDQNFSTNITPSTYYFLDQFGKLTEFDVRKNDKLFKKIGKKKLILGYHDSANLWLKLKIKNDTNQTLQKVLEYDYPIQEKIWFYADGRTFLGGYLFKPSVSRYITHPLFLTFKPYETKEILIKARDENVGLIAKLNLLNFQDFLDKNEKAKVINMLFFGSIFSLLLYNLFLLFLTRNISYLFYIGMMGSFFVLELFEGGFFSIYTPWVYFSQNVIYTLLLLMALSIIMFTLYFLEIPKNFPKIYRFIQFLAVVLIIVYILNITQILPTIFQRLLYMSLFLVIIILGIYAYKRGVTQAKYYLAGWMLLFFNTVLLGLNQAGIVAWIDYFPYIGKIAIFAEAILFSMALSALINTYKEEKERAVQALLEQTENYAKRMEEYADKKTRQLHKSVKEKETLLKELHHRVKNNLQIIISLLRLQSDTVDDTRAKQVLSEAENRIKALSTIHEMLYKNRSFQYIDIASYFDFLTQEIVESLSHDKKITYSIQSNTALSMEKAIYCGLILNELVTNAIKYAFEDEGHITIKFIKEGECYNFVVADNGKGIDSKTAKKSLGLELVETLIKNQLKGEIHIDSKNGTKFSLIFCESPPSPKIATKQ
ncbi:7TM diverse intracellular signaling domain-containing protein [Nitratiruptor sp. YY09-18]|uniref:7TM diverse intracellular signaling domain-containing protein n=1 Tax=Nitratiruptor sp. YY09-18 TaxID=2724901 RepID=UPI0019158D49|nr:7TM diverse intracellular signaling domain-containing protein [Nitratiruptor sp. YY09-18]BCD68511.1 hypothetical protein NitYY0918_C1428 [Nitratiruptor sp. YY09-18]